MNILEFYLIFHISIMYDLSDSLSIRPHVNTTLRHLERLLCFENQNTTDIASYIGSSGAVRHEVHLL